AIVEFCDLGEDDIFSLIENNSWVGKAGSYDLAGPAGRYTSIIEGSEETVLGFSNRAIVELRNLI
ncbi:MAG: Maf family protein, partial [Candidatus Thalassarchaeaceae archaeon]|nr:Maf family protein [Candidatus Thalassarchaeaceae archaeon]